LYGYFDFNPEESTMSDNDDNKAIPKRMSIAHHFIPSKIACVSFDVETAEVIGKVL